MAADFYGFGILDISNPAAPRLRGSLKTPGQAKSVAVVGDKAAIADHMSGVDFVDTSNADKPTMLGSFYVEGYAREVAAFGSMAYAVDAPTGVYAFDMTQPGAPEPVHTQQTATAPGMIVVSDPKAAPPNLAVLVGGGSLQVYDLTKPSGPGKAGSAEDAERPSAARRAARLARLRRRLARGPAGRRPVESESAARRGDAQDDSPGARRRGRRIARVRRRRRAV